MNIGIQVEVADVHMLSSELTSPKEAPSEANRGSIEHLRGLAERMNRVRSELAHLRLTAQSAKK